MAFIYSAVFLVLTTTPVSAIPISSATNTEPIFQPEPIGRGTVGLLTTCLATHFLCVWTAVHPNIIPNPTFSRTSTYKITLMILSAIVPEHLVIYSYGQWRSAKQVREAWLKQFKIKKGEDGDIGMEGGFFVVMGGVAVGKECNRTTLTAKGFQEYLSHISITDLRKDIICEKGKAGLVVKMIVFLQTSWFMIGCAIRVTEGLPVTLMEIHVMVQILSGVMIYMFWLHKPLDARDPILLDIALYPPPRTGELMGDISSETEVTVDKFPETKIWDPERHYTTEDKRSGTLNPILKAISDTYDFVPHTYFKLFQLAFLMTINGACHATAWNLQFPTDIECWLWRGACVSICVIPWLQVILVKTTGNTERSFHLLWELRFQKEGLMADVWRAIVRGTSEFFGPIQGMDQGLSVMAVVKLLFKGWVLVNTAGLAWAYGISVWFVAVEALVSTRSLPIGAYTTPLWSNYVPQI